jgi:NTE family protein
MWRLVDTSLRSGGVMRGDRLMSAIAEQIEDESIERMPIPFAAVATDLDTGQEVWLREGPMLSAVRASTGIPGLFSPVWYQDHWLVDGGVVNPVPVSLCLALGADYVIAVNLNTHLAKHTASNRRRALARDEEEREAEAHAASDHDDGDDPETRHPDSSLASEAEDDEDGGPWPNLDRWSSVLDGFVDAIKPARSAGPGLFDVMATSVNIMQDRITRSRMVGDPPAIMISPKLGHFGLLDFHRADEAIEIGRAAVEKVADELAELRALLP